MYHTMVHAEARGAVTTETAIASLVDEEISRRGNNYIFTDPFSVAMAYVGGATVTRARLNVPTINAYARHQLWPINASDAIPSNPQVDDYRDFPVMIPRNEDFIVEVLNTGASNPMVLLQVVPEGWTRNFAKGKQRILARATAAVPAGGTINIWQPPIALTFSETLRGGTYETVGMEVVGLNVLAARLVYVKGKLFGGLRLRPGVLAMNAIGNIPIRQARTALGPMGRWHTFEPPTIQVVQLAAGAVTLDIRMDLIFHGEGDYIMG